VTVDLITIVQILGPAVAVYAAIRADMAAMRVKLDRAEKDIQQLYDKTEFLK
jgi:hypothetical protein